MEQLLQAQVKAIGEHYVLARLLALGFIGGLAPENTKAVDIIAMSSDGKTNLQIQVKTRTEGRSSDNGWMMSEKHEKNNINNLYYVFVTLPKNWNDKTQPDTYIIPAPTVSTILIQAYKDWKSTPGKKGQQRNNTNLRRIRSYYKDSPTIANDWMEKYRDNWEILK